MSIATLINRPATIILRSPSGDTDEYGNEVPVEDELATAVELQQVRRDEPAGAGEVSDTRWLGFFPAGTDLTTADAVEIEGERYELEGDPWAVRNPRTGAESHVETTLCRVAGAEDAS